MSDEMFQAMMIPVFVAAFYYLIVKPLAFGVQRLIDWRKKHQA